MDKMNIYSKLLNIQSELKAPKNQFNKFGNYNYRNCEDILEAIKPLCKKYNTVLILDDAVEYVEGRYYICAHATLFDCESDNNVMAKAYARESITKKGMDDSQITGATSSYARKYALNGLFNIDDTKDADTEEMKEQVDKGVKPKKASEDQIERIRSYVESHSFAKLEAIRYMKNISKKTIDKLTDLEAKGLLDYFQSDQYVERLQLQAKEK